MPNNQPQLQSSLGDTKTSKTKQDRTWNMGNLALGKVLKVHPKRYTADVQLFKTNDIIMSPSDQEGKFSCKIGVPNAGFDTTYNKPYGTIIPLQKGSIVLVGFVRNMKGKPVILKVFHEISEETGQSNLKNILESEYRNLGESEINRYINITPIQDFICYSPNGDLEISSHSKSFLAFKEQEMDDEEFDYEDLSIRDATGKVTSVSQRFSTPKKLIAVFRDNYLDNMTNWLKVIINPVKTSIRLAKLQREGKVSLIEIDETGAIRLRRHLDTKSLDKFDSEDYTELCITEAGGVEVSVRGSKLSTLEIGGEGITLHSEGDMRITSGENLAIESTQNVNIECSGKAEIQGKNLKVTNSDTVEIDCKTASIKSTTANIECTQSNVKGDVSLTGTMKINGKRVAVQGDSISDNNTIK